MTAGLRPVAQLCDRYEISGRRPSASDSICSITEWMRQTQMMRGFVSDQDLRELSASSIEVPYHVEIAPLSITKCLGLPCVLSNDIEGSAHDPIAARSKLAQRFETCLGRCWQAPVSVIGDEVFSGSKKLPPSAELAAYLESGGYGVYKNCLSKRRSADSVCDALASPAFKQGAATSFNLGQSIRQLRATSAPVVYVVAFDQLVPADIETTFNVEERPHAFLEGLLILSVLTNTSEIIIHYSGIHQPTAGRLRRALNQLKVSKYNPPIPVRFCGPRPLTASDVLSETKQAAVLLLEPGVVARIAPALALGYDPRQFGGARSYAVMGCVTAPGVFQAGDVSVRDLLSLARGMKEGHTFECFVAGAWNRPALGAAFLDFKVDQEEIRSCGRSAYPICFLSKEAAVARQRAFEASKYRQMPKP
jgi:hypothetical protein